MERGNTKQKILDVSLDLFSKYGYDATSITMIAAELGIKKPSLYSHFSGKQEIFETIKKQVTEYYAAHALTALTDWNDPTEDHSRFISMSAETAAQKVLAQFNLLIHDPKISKIRKMLTIEQYHSKELADELEKRSYEAIMHYHEGLMRFLIEKGVLMDCDAHLMALQYIAPISLQLARVDRDPSLEKEAVELITKHIEQFNRMYRKKP